MTQHYFNTTYADAREQFLALCGATQGQMRSFRHPLDGPDGAIYIDIACWGSDRPERSVIVSSGTHGIEGYAGSGIQSSLLALNLHQHLASNTQLVMIHAVNPYGFAWQRRVNEDNVDLNRNFIDHSKSHSANSAYAEMAELLEPRVWDAESPALLRNAFSELIKQRGQPWFHAALTAGQYDHPQGQFYGGQTSTWSNQTLRTFARETLRNSAQVIHIDIHTALGKFGEGECIVEVGPDTDEFTQAKALWGERVKSTLSGDSTSAQVSGSMMQGMRQELDNSLIGTGLEFGTVASNEVIMALIADQWLHRHGTLDSDQGRAIKKQMMRAFCPDSEDWRTSVVDIARDVVNRAL